MKNYSKDALFCDKKFLYGGIIGVAAAFAGLCSAFIISSVGRGAVSADTVAPAKSTVNVIIDDGITIRVLDSTATTDLEDLAFDFTPTDAGVSGTKNAVVEVGTSNETGYKLYMNADWEDHEGSKTTSLVHTTSTINDTIPTSLPSSTPAVSSDYPFWYYTPTWSETIDGEAYASSSAIDKVIPPYDNPGTVRDDVDVPADSSKTNIAVTIGVDTSIAYGTYRSKLVFTATANPISRDYSLTLNSNGGYFDALSSKTTETDSITSTASQARFTLSNDDRPMKSGYTFLGWSENASATTADYEIGDTYEILADDASGTTKTLYAVYGPATFYNIYYMQEMTGTICQTATKPTSSAGKTEAYLDTTGAHVGNTAYVAQSTLYDIRDGKSYTVRRLADGNCWMTENLAYEMYVGEDYIGSKNDGSVFTFTATGNNTNDNAAEIMNGNTKPREATDQASGKTDIYWYYTWYAATAGVGQSGDANKDIDSSICPAHWKLPYNYSGTGGQVDKSFGNLFSAYGESAGNNNTTTTYLVVDSIPITLARTGQVTSGSHGNDVAGIYWASTAYSNQGNAYILAYSPVNAYPQYYTADYIGSSIRCVAL